MVWAHAPSDSAAATAAAIPRTLASALAISRLPSRSASGRILLSPLVHPQEPLEPALPFHLQGVLGAAEPAGVAGEVGGGNVELHRLVTVYLRRHLQGVARAEEVADGNFHERP